MSDPVHLPLAIVGMGCRFPGGACDPRSLWDLLANGRSGIVEVPKNRWDADRFYRSDPDVPGTMVTKWGGFVNNIDLFDARFFGISPREASRMDPQQRWLLEVAWEAMEDAGIAPQAMRGTKTGVFVGISSNDYAGIQMCSRNNIDVHTNSGSTLSIASNRISYLFDLKGPSLSVDTACSSALVAINLACHSIWSGESAAAVAGGVNALLTPETWIGFSKASMLSPTGKCYAFDARANGYVRAEGVGLVVIKPLDRAIADGDRIYATIRAAVLNQDGHTSTMTIPGREAQEALLEEAYRQAGMEPSRVVYMEAHGTGTPVGDPIEAAALGAVLSRGRAKGDACIIGSIKTNIGHLESGSGIAGLMKAALVLHQKMIPPSLNYETPNPNIAFADLKLRVCTHLQPLPQQADLPAVVAVNSFGFGGANAHTVLEAAPEAPSPPPVAAPADVERPFLLPVSARDDVALRRYAKLYCGFLKDRSISLPDVCWTAGARKEHHPLRTVIIGKDRAQLRARLRAFAGEGAAGPGIVTGRHSGRTVRPVFVFSGQGGQWWGMGQQLLRREPVFRGVVEEIDAQLKALSGWSLLEEMLRGEDDSNVDRTYVAQPAIFALQVALAALWESWGVTPAKVLGHSVGEVAAAYCAGIYSLDDAVKVIYHRSRLQEQTAGHGRMAAVGLSAAEAGAVIRDVQAQVHVAAINGPKMVTLSGDTAPMESVVAKLEDAGTFVRWLRIDHGFHTHQMDPIKDELMASLAGIAPRPAQTPWISTVTAGVEPGESVNADYWWRNVRQPVRLAPAIANLVRGGELLFLEIGAHPILKQSVSECLSEQGQKGGVFHSLRRGEDESMEVLANLAGMHIRGVAVDWAAINRSRRQFVVLPSYPWNREHFWNEAAELAEQRLSPDVHPLLGLRVRAPTPTWQFTADPGTLTYLKDHRFWDSVVFPGAGYAEIGLAVAGVLFPGESWAVEDLQILKALFISPRESPAVRVIYDETDRSFRVCSTSGGGGAWDVNARGRLQKLAPCQNDPADLAAIRDSLPIRTGHDEYYSDYAAQGYQFGPVCQEVQNVWSKPGEALAEIVVPDGILKAEDPYHFHPAVLDACFHAVKASRATPQTWYPKKLFYLPSAIHRLRLYAPTTPARLWAHARSLREDEVSTLTDILVYDDNGNRVADILGFAMDRVERRDAGAESIENAFYQFKWEPAWLRGSRAAGPANLASPAEIAESVGLEVPELHAKYGVDVYRKELAPRLANLAGRFVQNAFIQLGWRPQINSTFALADFVDELDIIENHQRLTHAFLDALKEDGVLQPAGDGAWQVVRLPERTDPDSELAALSEQFPQFAPDIELQKAAAPHLADVLSGEADAREMLFPGGSTELLDRFFSEGADFPASRELIAKAVARAVGGLPVGRVLRVLEVGAGAGALTRAVLPVLPTDRTEYTFTDVASEVVTKAKKQFANCPFMDFRAFNIEGAPANQGVKSHGYDLILVSHALHATADLGKALGTLRSCLAPGGLLMVLEFIHPGRELDTVFGLTKGWWRYADTDLRPRSAFISRPAWEDLLRASGFERVSSFADCPNADDALQAVLVASAPQLFEEENDAAVTADEPDEAPNHLVFADHGGTGDALAAELRARGHRVICVKAGGVYAADGEDRYTIAPDSEDDVRKLLGDIGLPGLRLMTLAHCWSLDHPDADRMTPEQLLAAQQTGTLHVLKLIHALDPLNVESRPKIFLVTRGAQSVQPDEGVRRPASTTLVGLARVACGEHDKFRWTRLDLDPNVAAEEARDLCEELILESAEQEVAYRGGRRMASRLQRIRLDEVPLRTRNAVQTDGSVLPYRVQVDKPGTLASLSLNETARREPGPHEIEIQVRAGGVNFRDVMKALGLYPGNPVDVKWFGDDFSGSVVRVGDKVKDLQVGDDVAGLAPYCFRSFATVDRRLVFKKPKDMTFEGAATLPTVFLTSHYAMRDMAQLREGESILIHAGTGGVGQAAIQIAKGLGLEIFSTAGTPEKRQLLKDMGIQHVMNSRSVDFADEIMAITKGRGVDAVLNSLAGDFIPKSLSVLAPYGRFLEIGKVDIYRDSRIGLRAFRNNISYFVIDMGQIVEMKPDRAVALMAEIAEKVNRGEYQPLPYTVFPIAEMVEAFRLIAQGKHVGKVVLAFQGDNIPVGLRSERGALFKRDAGYLVTGGAGGFGLEVAKWMASEGAGTLFLMSRSGPRDEAAQAAIDQLRADGVRVVDARGDVTNADDVRRVVGEVLEAGVPLKGVVHAATTLDDDFIVRLDTDRFNKVLHPKILGGWNLHLETKDLPLDHFICFSSFSSVVGAVKQGNYCAGNIFLDALAHYRRSQGLPALSLNWGAIAGAGILARNEKTAEYLAALGLKAFDIGEAVGVLRQTMLRSAAQITASRVDWPTLARFSPALTRSPTFAQLATRERGGQGAAIRARILAEAPADRARMVEDFVAEQVGEVLGGDASQVDRDSPLTQIGLDSLMALELVNRIERQMGIDLPIGMLLGAPSIRGVSKPLLELVLESARDADSGNLGGTKAGASPGLAPLSKSNLDPREFPLSEGQRGLWNLFCRAPESPSYHLVMISRMSPPMDGERMKLALAALCSRHPMLGATFARVEDRLVQRTGKPVEPEFHEHDVRELPEDQVKQLMVQRANRPFNLETGPVVRVETFRTTGDAQFVMLAMHHIVSDLWSVGVIMNELLESYLAMCEGRLPALETPVYGYHDFVDWQRQHLGGESGERMFAYWKARLADAPMVLQLPTDHPRVPFRAISGATYRFRFDQDVTSDVMNLANRYSATLYATLLAAYEVLMHRYCGQDDILIGCSTAGRPYPEFNNVVGFFSAPIAMRSRIADDPTFGECVRQASQAVIGAVENQYYPLSLIVEKMSLRERVPDRASLFQVSFSMEHVPGLDNLASAVFLIGQGGHRMTVRDISLETVEIDLRQAQMEITLAVEEAGGHLYGSWQYDRNLFDPATIERLHQTYQRLLAEAVADPERRISEIPLS